MVAEPLDAVWIVQNVPASLAQSLARKLEHAAFPVAELRFRVKSTDQLDRRNRWPRCHPAIRITQRSWTRMAWG
jgi:hypothetical protein